MHGHIVGVGVGKVGQVVVDIEGGGQLNHVVGVVVRRVDLAAGVVESGVNQVVVVVGTPLSTSPRTKFSNLANSKRASP